MRPRTPPLLAGALTLAAALLAPQSAAQIQRISLREMARRADGCVLGTITAREVVRIDHPSDGPELYYTFLTIAGTSLVDGRPLEVEVAYPGGFLDAENGAYNSVAPAEDDVRTGNRVVAFYAWEENIGGDLAANALFGSRGGLYRTYRAKGRTIIQGRGEGYAIASNMTADRCRARLREARRPEVKR